MTRIGRTFTCIAAGLLIGVVAQAGDKEKKLKKSDLPTAVQTTADRESAGGKVTGYSKGMEGGQVVYEVNVVLDGMPEEILIGPDGVVVAVEKQIHWDQVPADVQSGLKQEAGKGKIGKVSSISKNGKVVGYETSVIRNGKKENIEVGADGKPMTQPQ